MKICRKCNGEFPSSMTVNGKRMVLKNRAYCLNCSPYKAERKRNDGKEIVSKLCPICDKILPADHFYDRSKNGDKASYCKKCFNSRCNERWIQRKTDAIKYLGGECKHCGLKTNHYSVYDFHHREQLEKETQWDQLKRRSLDKIKIELDKCDLLCANCHRIVHEGKFNHVSVV